MRPFGTDSDSYVVTHADTQVLDVWMLEPSSDLPTFCSTYTLCHFCIADGALALTSSRVTADCSSHTVGGCTGQLFPHVTSMHEMKVLRIICLLDGMYRYSAGHVLLRTCLQEHVCQVHAVVSCCWVLRFCFEDEVGSMHAGILSVCCLFVKKRDVT